MITVDYLITSLIVVLIPGTGVIYTVSTALLLGKRASFFASLGCTAGIIPHLLASMLGLAAILHTSALAFQVLKFAGVAYLLYIAYATWRDKEALSVGNAPRDARATAIVVKACLLNILNPKLSIFFLAFLPQFISLETTTPLADMMALSIVFMLMTFAVFIVYGLLAHAFRHAVIESPRVQSLLRRTFAAAFAGLGLNLALSDR